MLMPLVWELNFEHLFHRGRSWTPGELSPGRIHSQATMVDSDPLFDQQPELPGLSDWLSLTQFTKDFLINAYYAITSSL